MESPLILLLSTGAPLSSPQLTLLAVTSSSPNHRLRHNPSAHHIMISLFMVASWPAAKISAKYGPRLAVLMGTTAQVFGWVLMGCSWTSAGSGLLGVGSGLIKEGLVPMLQDRSKAAAKLQMRLIWAIHDLLHTFSPIVFHWLGAMRWTVLGPAAWSWACLMAFFSLISFLLGILAFFRLPKTPVVPKEDLFLFTNEGIDASQGEWFLIIVYAVCMGRFALHQSMAFDSAFTLFIDDYIHAEEYVECNWKVFSVSGLVSYPILWYCLDIFGYRPILYLSILCWTIWGHFDSSKAFPKSMLALLLSMILRPSLMLSIMSAVEETTGACQCKSQDYARIFSFAGCIVFVILTCGSLVYSLDALTYIFNNGLMATLVTALFII